MRPSLTARHVAGWLVVLAALAFGSHGVRVVRNGERVAAAPLPVTADGPACREAPAHPTVDWSQLRQRLSERARARRASGRTEQVIVLNGSGYNYGSPPDPQPQPGPASR